MDFGNQAAEDGEYPGTSRLQRKGSDSSIWMSLDFPRVCVESLIADNTKSKSDIGFDCESMDPAFRSDMFLSLLENARRKLDETITGSCKKPCCVDSRKEQAKKELEEIQQDCSWDTDETMSTLGFRGFSQELRMLEEDGTSVNKAEFFEKKISATMGPSYFSEGTSLSLWGPASANQADSFATNTFTVDKAFTPSYPHEGLFYVLPYLLLKDLLSVEQVCKSLRDTISGDVLLWQHFKVDHSLNTKLTDEILLKLTSRSQGRLKSLTLIECMRISDEAVERVVTANPMISRILLPGCLRISVDAVVRMVELLNQGKPRGYGVKQIKIRGLSGVSKDNLERLQILLGMDKAQRKQQSKPHYYLCGDATTNYDRAIDVEICPRCNQPRAVFDCTRAKCRDSKALKIPECRGCIFCISRCEDCGMCINDSVYEETFCLRLLCSDCWLRLPKCLECNKPGCESSAEFFIRRPDAVFVCPDCQGSYGSSGFFYVR